MLYSVLNVSFMSQADRVVGVLKDENKDLIMMPGITRVFERF